MFQNIAGARGGTFCMNSAGLAEGTNANTIKTVAANGTAFTDYAIDGLLYAKADTDNIAMTALAVQADLTSCLYLVQINAAGTVSLKKGTEQLTQAITDNLVALNWPEPDDLNCALGYIRVVNSGGTFTSGTTDLGAATVTDTYYNTLVPPIAPLV